MSKRKISSYFQRETDKIIDEAEENTENEFHEDENDTRLPNRPFYSCMLSDLGSVSRKPRNVVGPVKPLLDHL